MYPIKFPLLQSRILCEDLTVNDPGSSLQGYTLKKRYVDHGNVFFCFMPLKQGPVLVSK